MSILDTIRSNAEAKQKAAAYDKQMLDNAMVAEREGGARDIVNGLAYELSKRPSVNMPWEFANQYGLMPANRLDSGQRGLGVNGYDADRYGVADERSANAAMQEEMIARRALDRMRGANTTDGRIEPRYWSDAQTVSNWEQEGL